jgi:hypothetical protein
MSDQKLPPGWDEARIREVIEHYDAQVEDERAAEIEADVERGWSLQLQRPL